MGITKVNKNLIDDSAVNSDTIADSSVNSDIISVSYTHLTLPTNREV